MDKSEVISEYVNLERKIAYKDSRFKHNLGVVITSLAVGLSMKYLQTLVPDLDPSLRELIIIGTGMTAVQTMIVGGIGSVLAYGDKEDLLKKKSELEILLGKEKENLLNGKFTPEPTQIEAYQERELTEYEIERDLHDIICKELGQEISVRRKLSGYRMICESDRYEEIKYFLTESPAMLILPFLSLFTPGFVGYHLVELVTNFRETWHSYAKGSTLYSENKRQAQFKRWWIKQDDGPQHTGRMSLDATVTLFTPESAKAENSINEYFASLKEKEIVDKVKVKYVK